VPLEAPQLDNRKFEDLLREAQLRIPRYAPEWTDFNESDPGITLVQLFAWLTEMMLYRMNRVPERNYIKFLQLIGLELQPAQPATAHLTISAKQGAPEVRSVPRRAQVQAQPLEGEPLIFETLEGLDLIRVPLEDLQVFDGAAATKVSELNKSQSTPFPPFGWIPQVGSALYLGFTPEQPAATARQFPRQMRFRVFLPAESQAGQPVSCNEQSDAPTPPVELVWEYRPQSDPTRWRRLNVFKDETVAFTREGYILVEGPRDPAATTGVEKVPESRYWLRVRLAKGSYPAGRAPVIDFIRPNTVEAENLSTIRDELMGTSEGLPDQTFTFVKRPVQRDPLQVVTVQRVGQEEIEESWQCVDDFLASGPEDKHFVLNATRGEITFGNGERGLIPPADTEILARLYRYGGGTAGNVGLGTEWTLRSPVKGTDKVIGERPATGGRDEQKVEELTDIAPRIMRSRDRAITADDFAALASQAGEVRKASAIPLAHPDHPGVEIAGAVTVVIVPDADIQDRSPKPSADLISRVCQFLDARRLLTTELYVKGPEYKQIKVEARVEANPYAAFDTVALNVINAINTYLDPLGRTFADAPAGDAKPPSSTSSSSSGGWAFGRDLFPTNLYSVILRVEDVVAVPFLEIRIDGQPHAINDPVTLRGDGLFYGASDHDIVVVPAVDRQ
jgi:predicted phage baseplate assembly protein